jgi:Protein of unknown function (DUF2752)
MTPHRTMPSRSRYATFALLAAPPVAIILAAALLLHYPPAQYPFYPQCPIHLYLHLDCPGCGTTRALAALLQGHLREALRLNALTTLLLPIAIFYAVRSYIHLLRSEPIHLPQPSTRTLQLACAITVAFTILRNLPTHAF